MQRYRFLQPWLAALVLALSPLLAAAAPVEVHVFWRVGCPHCEHELEWLETLRARDPDVRVHLYEVSRDARNRRVLGQLAQTLHARLAVPFTVVGDEVIVGWWDEATTGVQIEQRVIACRAQGCPDVVGPALAHAASEAAPAVQGQPPMPPTIRVPLLGELRTRDLSLPALTVVLGAIDGFNPCAMWTLIFLIGLLVGMQDRVRMWTLGGAFIVASAAVYFMFMAAWLNLLLFLGALPWIRIAIGAVAIAGGVFYLREFWVNRTGTCRVTGQGRRRRVMERLGELTSQPAFLLALGGIVLLAFAVNLIELLCSAGLPAIYTQVLSMSALPTWQYYGYMLLYIAVFMLDDLVVFISAMATLQVSGLAGGYSRWSHLVGGLVLVALGALMWARPGWLMFG